MGACFNSESFDGTLNDAGLTRAYNARVRDLTEEFGTDAYNGTFSTLRGLTVSDKLFDSYQEAETYVADNTAKWENALAVKYKDTNKETTKAPTFNNVKREECTLVALDDYTLLAVVKHGETVNGKYETRALVADQLPASKRTKLIALYNDYVQKARVYNEIKAAFLQLVAQVSDVLFTPEKTVFAELKKLHGHRARAYKAMRKAAEKLKTADIKCSAGLYATKLVDKGTKWLVGGWCAE